MFRLPTFAELDAAADKLQDLFDKGDAKTDTIGAGGNYTFKIADLLANDVNAKAGTFFFGDGLDALKQAEYIAAHGITKNADGSFTATAGIDFEYSVLTGKGFNLSYSSGDVDVKAAPHAGAVLFSENFDGYGDLAGGSYGKVNLATNGWTAGTFLPGGPDDTLGEIVRSDLWAGAPHASSGSFLLDTQEDPGGINISHAFVDPTAGQYKVSFDLGIMSFGPNAENNTQPNGVFQVLVDGSQIITTIDASDFAQANVMEHFEFVVNGGGLTNHSVQFVDMTPGDHQVGFALDTIQVTDWLV